MRNENERQRLSGKPLSPAEVVDNLIDIYRRPLINEIDEKLKNSEKLKRIVFIGCPGAGKSTICEGIKQKLVQRNFRVEIISFDIFRQAFLDELLTQGLHIENLSELSAEQQELFKQYLTYGLTIPSERLFSDKKQTLQLIEVPAVGFIERGQSALRKMGENMQKTRYSKLGVYQYEIDTLAIHVVADNKVSEQAKKARVIAYSCSNDFELKKRLETVGIYIGKPNFSDVKNTEFLRKFRRMASANQIDTIANEYNELVESAYNQILTEKGSDLLLHSQMAIQMPNAVNIQEHTSEWIDITKKCIYANFQFFREFKFPTSEALLVAINQFAGSVRYTK